MPGTLRHWTLLWFGLATLGSAFLVFQVQPVISRTVLPWFGGSPSVWTTCMLFFQVVLFAGYAYAHLTRRWFSPRWQGLLHLVLISGALCVLPITPADTWKPTGVEQPVLHILYLLAANVGVPYFLLSSTGPLLQAWYSDAAGDRSPYWLYALSNVGSLAALITYPFLVEPAMSTSLQGNVWSLGFCLFAFVCSYLAILVGRAGDRHSVRQVEQPAADLRRPAFSDYVAWLLLPAFASTVLLATTNHVCQDVAVVPFLWIAPLSLYLLTFILCFAGDRWYSRRWYGLGTVAGVAGLTVLMQTQEVRQLALEVTAFLGTMFMICMVCHGELVMRRPQPRFLTAFYLFMSAGGAVGGIAVGLLCPLVFDRYSELNLSLIAAAAIAMLVFLQDAQATWWGDSQRRRVIAAFAYFAVFLFVGSTQYDQMVVRAADSTRSFYGVIKVVPDEAGEGMSIVHGRTIHGFQYSDAGRRKIPTTYFSTESGIGRTIAAVRGRGPLRVGIIGLGCGTLAAYGQPGDSFRFYEINPDMVRVAREHFKYLSDSQADCQVVLGDARLSLEREAPQRFDVLVLDAFSSDAIPAHLLTREAFDVYLKHIQPGGVIAAHISNRHVKLEPVLQRAAEHCGMHCAQIRNSKDESRWVKTANWILMSHEADFFALDAIAPWARPVNLDDPHFEVWTDQRNNLFEIVVY